ncbi:hypothetical protein AB0H73_05040 [Streptomyces olivoreticuli]
MGPLRERRAGRQVDGLPEVARARRTARDVLHEDDYDRAMDSLRRGHRTLQARDAARHPIAAPAPAPARFSGFREASGTASGLPSAMYPHLEFPLGLVPRRRNDRATAARSVFPEFRTARGHV